MWGPGSVSIEKGSQFQIANTSGITSSCFKLTGGIKMDGVAGTAGSTQFATYTAGTWTEYAAAITVAELFTLLTTPSTRVPATAAIINPDTGSKIMLNGGVTAFT
jgi:hypothetical protein